VLSIPLLMFGGFAISGLLERFPILIVAGGALLGWVAGDIAMSDPLIASWASTQSPFLAPIAPWLIAGFVILEVRFVNEHQQKRRLAATQSGSGREA
jgi:predicted tellurium resistance membrane protein TerC